MSVENDRKVEDKTADTTIDPNFTFSRPFAPKNSFDSNDGQSEKNNDQSPLKPGSAWDNNLMTT